MLLAQLAISTTDSSFYAPVEKISPNLSSPANGSLLLPLSMLISIHGQRDRDASSNIFDNLPNVGSKMVKGEDIFSSPASFCPPPLPPLLILPPILHLPPTPLPLS